MLRVAVLWFLHCVALLVEGDTSHMLWRALHCVALICACNQETCNMFRFALQCLLCLTTSTEKTCVACLKKGSIFVKTKSLQLARISWICSTPLTLVYRNSHFGSTCPSKTLAWSYDSKFFRTFARNCVFCS